MDKRSKHYNQRMRLTNFYLNKVVKLRGDEWLEFSKIWYGNRIRKVEHVINKHGYWKGKFLIWWHKSLDV